MKSRTLFWVLCLIGAGVCKSPGTTKKWLEIAPVVSGSYTPEARAGNIGERLFYPDTYEEFVANGFGLNSFGMPNMGNASAAREFTDYKGEQPLIVSIAGFSLDDYIDGVVHFSSTKSVAAIELNFGCPNTQHGKIMSFNPRLLDTFFRLLRVRDQVPIWVKFSPYSDPELLKEVASVVNDSNSIIKAVVTCNTFANAYAGKNAISPNQGLAGLSGRA